MLLDFHVHSRYSDGELLPAELIPFIKDHGVSVVSVTDHDTISGLDGAVKAGKEHGVAVIPGVELTTYFEDIEVHILGYDIDYKNSEGLADKFNRKYCREDAAWFYYVDITDTELELARKLNSAMPFTDNKNIVNANTIQKGYLGGDVG